MPACSPVLKPPALRPGDTVAVVAPASAVDRREFERGRARLIELGYEVTHLDSIFDRDLYFAGTLDRRLREFHQMFERPEVRAIVCARGGYGCNYLLPHLELDVIRRNPKLLVGYSDLTSLLTYLHDATGLITMHGPMVCKDFALDSGVHELSWRAATSAGINWELGSHQLYGFRDMIAGHCDGVLYGGCLSMLVASLGTPYEIQTEGKLLFIEDVHARPYQIDRMLMQLKLAGKLDPITGLIFGEMMHCSEGADQGFTLQEVVYRIVRDLGVPVAYGLRSGHVSEQNITLPFGVSAALSVAPGAVRLEITEPAIAHNAVSVASAES